MRFYDRFKVYQWWGVLFVGAVLNVANAFSAGGDVLLRAGWSFCAGSGLAAGGMLLRDHVKALIHGPPKEKVEDLPGRRA